MRVDSLSTSSQLINLYKQLGEALTEGLDPRPQVQVRPSAAALDSEPTALSEIRQTYADSLSEQEGQLLVQGSVATGE